MLSLHLVWENGLLSWEGVWHLGGTYSRALGRRLVVTVHVNMSHTDNTFVTGGDGRLLAILWPEDAKFRDGHVETVIPEGLALWGRGRRTGSSGKLCCICDKD